MSLRGRITLPSFDWTRVARLVPGLLGLVEPDGRIVALTGRLFDEDPDILELTYAWHLAAAPHQQRLQDAIARAATAGTQRVVVRSRRVDRLYAVELSADGNGQIVMLWAGLDEEMKDDEQVDPELVETPLAPLERHVAPPRHLHVETPPPAPPARVPHYVPPPSPPAPPPVRTVAPASLDYVVVASHNLRRLAARLQRTIDLATPRTAVWFDEEFESKASRLTNTSKVLFLGPSKYADFMRKVVKPRFDQAGAAWGTTERKALFWIHEEGDERDVRRRMEAAMSKVAKVSLSRSVSLTGDEPPTGKELAGKLLLEPSPNRPSLDEERYLLAIAMFLLEGFEAFHRTGR